MAILIGLLIAPALAVQLRGPDFYWIGIYAVIISAITYWVYAVDKRRAEEGLWRVPETHLHFLELLGGWPGAFLAQRRLHHKCSKCSYQLIFWLIVLAYQFAACDSFHNWHYTRAAVKYVEQSSHHQR